MREWRITIIRKRGETLGTLWAPDAEAAIKRAIEDYGITDPHRQRRLVATPIEQSTKIAVDFGRPKGNPANARFHLHFGPIDLRIGFTKLRHDLLVELHALRIHVATTRHPIGLGWATRLMLGHVYGAPAGRANVADQFSKHCVGRIA